MDWQHGLTITKSAFEFRGGETRLSIGPLVHPDDVKDVGRSLGIALPNMLSTILTECMGKVDFSWMLPNDVRPLDKTGAAAAAWRSWLIIESEV